MKVAIIGSGIAGNTTAYLLCDKHEITLFEKEDRIGGHSHTHEVSIENKIVSVDTGFIVFNKKTYPLFTRLLDDLNVDYINSHMSFSVHSKKNNFEYNGTNLNGLFAQRKNLLNPRFLMMIYEIFKFNKHAKKILNQTENITMDELLNQLGLSGYFQQNYIFPMGSAIWSSDINAIMNFPAHFFIQFFENHGMLSINERPQWLTIKDGSKNYVAKLTEKFKDKIRTNSQIKTVHRKKDKVEVQSNHGNETYDYVFFCMSQR
jgi:predicted NAD/FAD-binding protein